jgi:hypothetical protein
MGDSVLLPPLTRIRKDGVIGAVVRRRLPPLAHRAVLVWAKGASRWVVVPE